MHTALSVAVELETDVFNWFRSARHIHQTAVPVIHSKNTDEIVFNDICKNIIAWGSVTPSPTVQANRRKLYIKHKEGGCQNQKLRVTKEIFASFIFANMSNQNLPNFIRDANEEDIDLGDVINGNN